MTDDMPEFIDTAEAARISGRSQITVLRALRSGELKGWKFHRQWVTTRDEVRRWVLRDMNGERDEREGNS